MGVFWSVVELNAPTLVFLLYIDYTRLKNARIVAGERNAISYFLQKILTRTKSVFWTGPLRCQRDVPRCLRFLNLTCNVGHRITLFVYVSAFSEALLRTSVMHTSLIVTHNYSTICLLLTLPGMISIAGTLNSPLSTDGHRSGFTKNPPRDSKDVKSSGF